jgi:hypothetical protein
VLLFSAGCSGSALPRGPVTSRTPGGSTEQGEGTRLTVGVVGDVDRRAADALGVEVVAEGRHHALEQAQLVLRHGLVQAGPTRDVPAVHHESKP